jgi:hypothetical protein
MGIQFSRTGPQSNVRVYVKIRAMEPGQTLEVRFADWKAKTPLGHMLHNISNYRGRFSVRLLKNGTGWRVTRVS